MRNHHRRLCALESDMASDAAPYGSLEETAAFIRKVIADESESLPFDPSYKPVSEVDTMIQGELATLHNL